MTPNFNRIIETNKCGFIPREKIGDVSNGVLSPSTMAKLDSLGQGIKGRFRIGRKVCYTPEAVVEFLTAKCQVIDDENA